jgi:hypothetical protein
MTMQGAGLHEVEFASCFRHLEFGKKPLTFMSLSGESGCVKTDFGPIIGSPLRVSVRAGNTSRRPWI